MFAAIFLLCNLAYGQTVKKEAYDKAVDYLNCKAVELSLKDAINTKDENGNLIPKFKENYDSYLNVVPCERDISSKKITAYFSGIKGYKNTKELSAEIDTLKKSFNQDLKLEEIAKFLSEDIFFDNKYPKLVEFANKRIENPEFGQFKAELNTNLPRLLAATTQGTNSNNSNVNSNVNINSNVNSDVNVNSNSSVNKVGDEEDWFDFTTLILIIVFFILAIGLLFLYVKLSALHDKVRSIEVSHNALKSDVKNPPRTATRTTSNSNSDEVAKLQDEITKFKAEIYELRAVVDVLQAKVVLPKIETEKTEQRRYEQTFNKEPVREVFYLSTPNEDSSFNEKSAHSSYREGTSIYKFTKISSEQAEFQIDEREESIKLALEYPDKNIDPVCEAQNTFNPKANRIVTVQGGLGKAVLDRDKWKIVKKAVIRYEH